GRRSARAARSKPRTKSASPRPRRREVEAPRSLQPGRRLPSSPQEDEVTRGGMTKAELVEEVSQKTGLPKKQAEIVVNTVFESIVETLKTGEKIELRGFGSFRIRQRGSRMGRNPTTGEKVDVPAKRIPYFKPGKELRELLNQE